MNNMQHAANNKIAPYCRYKLWNITDNNLLLTYQCLCRLELRRNDFDFDI